MPSEKDLARMNLAESMILAGEPDQAERAIRAIDEKEFREHGLMCIARDIAMASARISDRRYSKRLLKQARRISESIEESYVREQAMAYVDAVGEM